MDNNNDRVIPTIVYPIGEPSMVYILSNGNWLWFDEKSCTYFERVVF